MKFETFLDLYVVVNVLLAIASAALGQWDCFAANAIAAVYVQLSRIVDRLDEIAKAGKARKVNA